MFVTEPSPSAPVVPAPWLVSLPVTPPTRRKAPDWIVTVPEFVFVPVKIKPRSWLIVAGPVLAKVRSPEPLIAPLSLRERFVPEKSWLSIVEDIAAARVIGGVHD